MKTTCRQAVTLLVILASFLGLNAEAQWIHSTRDGNIAYFLFQSSPRLERYSLFEEQWLSPIELPTAHEYPTTFCVDEAGLYVAYDTAVKSYDSLGGNETHMINTAQPVRELFTDGGLLLLNHNSGFYGRLTTVNKTTGAIISSYQHFGDYNYGASIAPSINKVFGRSLGSSPADIGYFSYLDDGTLVDAGDSPHHGDYASASRTWVFPDDTKVVDDSGTVYGTDTLTYLTSLGENIDDLAFVEGGIPIVLRSTNLILFSDSLLPVGSRALSYSPGKIYAEDTNVFTFTFDSAQTNGIRVEKISIDTITPPKPGSPIDPNGIKFVPDYAFIDTNRVLYLFSRTNESLFRWDTVNQRYLESIRLLGSPSFCAYSELNHTVYLAYPSRLIRQIDLSETNFNELPFANLPGEPTGLSVAGKYVFATDPSGGWSTHYTFSSDGEPVDQKDGNYYSREFIWSEANQKMYFFMEGTSPLMWEQINANGITYSNLPPGGIGWQREGDIDASIGIKHSIRVSPDGAIVVVGSGIIYDPVTLESLPMVLANPVRDVAWVNGKLRSIRSRDGATELQQWNGASYGLGTTRLIGGRPHRLLALGTNRLVAISINDSRPSIHVMNGTFSIEPPPLLEAPSSLDVGVGMDGHINLLWRDVDGEESYTIERSTSTNGVWSLVGTTGTSFSSFFDGPFAVGSVFYYRVTAHNGVQSSLPSLIAKAYVVPPSATTLAVAGVLLNSVTLTWEDVLYETSYVLERKTGDAGNWIQVANLWRNVTRYTVTDLEDDTLYYFRIKAVNGLGSSAFSPAVSATTMAVLPATPYLSIWAWDAFYVHLNWFHSFGKQRGFILERRTLPSSEWEIIAQLNDIAFVDWTVSPSTDYEYRLCATNSAGSSPYSTIQAVTTSPIPIPETPQDLSARTISAEAIAVAWRNVRGEDGFVLQRCTLEDPVWADLVTLSTNVTRYEDTAVISGGHYFYRVKAFNHVGSSGFSAEEDALAVDLRNLIEDTFDPALNSNVWWNISGGIVTNAAKGFLDGNALWFGGGGIRKAVTIPMDLRAGGYLNFSIRAGNQQVDGAEFWENSPVDERVFLDYSSGNNYWNSLTVISTSFIWGGEWVDYSIEVPLAARGTQTKFRWRQANDQQPGHDTWALENVSVQSLGPPPPPAPSVVEVTNTIDSITISWTAALGAASYIVERSKNNQAWTRIVEVFPFFPDLNYIDRDVERFSSYSYRVIAVNMGGESAPSEAATAMLTARLGVAAFPWESGTFVLDPPQPPEGYPFGTVVTVRATPSGTNVFSAWCGAKATLLPQVTVTMNSDLYLTALHNNEGKLVFQDPATGKIALWFMNGHIRLGSVFLNNGANTSSRLLGVGDFTRDNSADLLFRSPEGILSMTILSNNVSLSNVILRSATPLKAEWKFVGAGDFNNDQSNDLIWFNSVTRKTAVWFMDDTDFVSAGLIRGGLPLGSAWRMVSVADFNGDKNGDLLLQRSTGETAIWLMSGTALSETVLVRNGLKVPQWKAIGVGGFNWDNSPDILFQNADRKLSAWYLEGTNCIGNGPVNRGTPLGSAWQMRGVK